jgi:hypothetical protein
LTDFAAAKGLQGANKDLSGSENREPENKQNKKDGDENVKQDAGDIGGGRRDAGESQHACNN